MRARKIYDITKLAEMLDRKRPDLAYSIARGVPLMFTFKMIGHCDNAPNKVFRLKAFT